MSFKVLLSFAINVRAKRLSGRTKNYDRKVANKEPSAMKRDSDFILFILLWLWFCERIKKIVFVENVKET